MTIKITYRSQIKSEQRRRRIKIENQLLALLVENLENKYLNKSDEKIILSVSKQEIVESIVFCIANASNKDEISMRSSALTTLAFHTENGEKNPNFAVDIHEFGTMAKRATALNQNVWSPLRIFLERIKSVGTGREVPADWIDFPN
jgi:hypothetical protein